MGEPGRRLLLRAAAVATSFAVALALAEAGLRLSGAAAVYRMGDFEIELDRDLLFRIRPHCTPEVNALGYRDREFGTRGHGRRILFLGDSFVLGAGVPARASLPKALERRLGGAAEVLNLGVWGYGPDQALAAFLGDGVGLGPDLVLLGLFPGNDFEDLVKNELVLVGPSGALRWNRANPVASALPRSALLLKARMALTGHFLAPDTESNLVKGLVIDPYTRLGPPEEEGTRRRLLLMTAVLAAWRDETTRRGIPAGVVVFPAWQAMAAAGVAGNGGTPVERPFVNEEAAIALLRRVGLPALDLRGPFLGRPAAPLYNPRDQHLSEEGNEVAAGAVAEFLLTLR